jgi:L-alanine-DL-glutamate epimerase-like enolase superfamily enzyme
LPHEQWEPGVKLLNTPDMFEMDKDMITIPQGPGLGMDVNEDAIEEYRVRL